MKKKLIQWALAIGLLQVSFSIFPLDIQLLPDTNCSNLPHAALGREAAIDMEYIYSAYNNTHYMQFGVGGKVTVASMKFSEELQLGIGGYGWIYTLFDIFSQSFNFLYADFLMGGFVDVRYGNFVLETFLYHTSHHLGDDFLYYHYGDYLNMGIEAIKQYVNYDLYDFLTLSLGIEYKFGKRPENLVFYDLSLFSGFRMDLIDLSIPLFLDTETELFGLDNPPNFGFRLGFYANFFNLIDKPDNERSKKHHEFYIGYYNGFSKKIYFYNAREQLFYIGGGMRF